MRRNRLFGLMVFWCICSGASGLYAQPNSSKVGIQCGAGLNRTTVQGGYGVHAGLFWNHLELTGRGTFAAANRRGVTFEGAYIRKDLGQFFQGGCFVNYTYYDIPNYEFPIRPNTGARVDAFGLGLEGRIRLVANLQGVLQLGVCRYLLIPERNNSTPRHFINTSLIQLGLNYQFYLKGKRDTTPGIKADYFDGGKLAFNYRFGSQISSFLNLGGVLNGGEHHFSASYKVNQWLHPYVGGIFGPWYSAYRDTVDLPFTLKGIEVGARAYTVQREHWAIYQDVSYGYVKRPNIYLYQSRFSLGNFFSVKLHPALRANAGLLLNFYDQDVLVEMSAGISVTPFFNTGIMGEK